MNRRRAEPNWQTSGEVAGPKLELQRKKFQEKNNEIVQRDKNLSVLNATDVFK